MSFQVSHRASCVSPAAGSNELIYKCCECHEEHSSIERLEFHLWACHLRTFPFNCSLCSYPALTAKAMTEHFGDRHPEIADSVIEFKRRLDLETRLRSLLAQSIHLAVLRCESARQIYEGQPIAPSGSIIVNRLTRRNNVAGDEVFQNELVEEFEEGVVEESMSRFVYEIEEASSFGYYGEQDNEVVQFEDDDRIIHEVMPSRSATLHGRRQLLPLDVEPSSSTEENSKSHLMDHDANDNRRRRYQMVDNSIVEMATSKGREARRQKSCRTATYYKCEQCDKIIRYPSKIKEHQRSHTGERPFQCHICKLSFSQKGALKCHIRLHTGEKPFKCTWECGKSFVSSSARLLHEKAHSGEKPFVCQFCNHRFGTKYHLNRHVNTRHNAIVNKPTGLEAAGEHAPVIEGLVTSVIEDVRRNKKA
ncbi:hypothetical protein QR680_009381 [Steinernema hermaphroditum]|uniref:C2H2-type domain-containing protein n=1 Tax=Steinernema hermaphroditum TaxID=289476 RepID=A0AA39M9T6_9BILA|nr:hypothetical protein QR680_009381 [Steinernema hermaphroditum]